MTHVTEKHSKGSQGSPGHAISQEWPNFIRIQDGLHGLYHEVDSFFGKKVEGQDHLSTANSAPKPRAASRPRRFSRLQPKICRKGQLT